VAKKVIGTAVTFFGDETGRTAGILDEKAKERKLAEGGCSTRGELLPGKRGPGALRIGSSGKIGPEEPQRAGARTRGSGLNSEMEEASTEIPVKQ
jgi:hypothetical protein